MNSLFLRNLPTVSAVGSQQCKQNEKKVGSMDLVRLSGGLLVKKLSEVNGSGRSVVTLHDR